MLNWSPAAVKATMGLGGLGLMVLLSEQLADAGVAQPFALVFPLAFAPAIVFMLIGDVRGRAWARRLQVAAIAWYASAVLAGLGGALQRGLPRHDLFFLAFVAVGVWPCVVAARALARHARGQPPARPEPDARFAPRGQPAVLRAARGKWLRVAAGMVVFFGIGLMPGYRHDNPAMAWATLVFCGLGALFAFSQIAWPSTLTLDAEGFETATFGRRHRTRWADVAGFGMVEIPGGHRMVSIAYAPGYRRQRVARALAKNLSDAEGALPGTYEVSGEALAILMERWRLWAWTHARPSDNAATA